MTSRLAFVAVAFAARSALAQEKSPDTARVPTVIVTATRVPLSQSALPVAVSVITSEELRVRGITTVADALQDVTSAYVAQAGSPGATTSLFLRGGESKYVKVLVDGVPVNDPGGAYDFAALTTDNVDRIEVVRGPASVIYGADAVTGVVNVITRRGVGPSSADMEMRIGTAPRARFPGQTSPSAVRALDVTASTSGALAGNSSSGSYSFGIGRHQSNGLYQLNNHYLDNVLSARLAFEPVSGTELRLALRYTDHRYDYPTDGGGTPVDSNAFFADDRTVVGVEVEHALAATTRATLAINSSVNDGGTNDALDAPGGNSYVSQDKIRRRGAELRVQFLPSRILAATVGAQLEQQDQRSQAQGAFGAFPFTSLFQASRRNTGGYGEAVVTASQALTLTLGGRVDDNEQFGTFSTGRAGASWRPLPSTRLRATAGTAFREPTFFENYSTGFVTGNPALEPERSRSFDVGLDQGLGRGDAHVSLTAFAQRFRNMIDYTGDTTSCGYSYCNVAAAESNGVEAEVESRIVSGVYATLGATLLRTKVLDSGFDTSSAGLYRAGESLIRRPEHTFAAELAYRGRGPLSANARLLRVGERSDRDFRPYPATPVTLPAYERVDVGAEYLLPAAGSSRAALTLRVENLQNTGYETVFNFLAPRRTISVGLRARL